MFVVKRGRARFTIGDVRSDATAVDDVPGLAGLPHDHKTPGPGPPDTIDIHLARRWVQTGLHDPSDPTGDAIPEPRPTAAGR